MAKRPIASYGGRVGRTVSFWLGDPILPSLGSIVVLGIPKRSVDSFLADFHRQFRVVDRDAHFME
jgi:hypothetical protein